MNGRPRTKAAKKRRVKMKKDRREKKTLSRVMPMLSRATVYNTLNLFVEKGLLRELVARYVADRNALPESWREEAGRLDARRRNRLIGDFVAGMTDRYAIGEHKRLFATTPALR